MSALLDDVPGGRAALRRDGELRPLPPKATGYATFELAFRDLATDPRSRRGPGRHSEGVDAKTEDSHVIDADSPWRFLFKGSLRTNGLPMGGPRGGLRTRDNGALPLPQPESIETCRRCGTAVEKHKRAKHKGEPRCRDCDELERFEILNVTSPNWDQVESPLERDERLKEEARRKRLDATPPVRSDTRVPTDSPADAWDQAGGDQRGADDELGKPIRHLSVVGPPDPDDAEAAADKGGNVINFPTGGKSAVTEDRVEIGAGA
jgi:hypothetical protein